MKFSELIRLLEQEGFRLIKQKGSIRYYAKAGHPHLIRVDFHGAKEVPTGTAMPFERGRSEAKIESYDYAAIFACD